MKAESSSWWTFRKFFIFFLLLGGGEGGVRGAGRGRETIFMENPKGGVVSRACGGRGARGREGVCGEFGGGGGAKYFFFSGPKFPPSNCCKIDTHTHQLRRNKRTNIFSRTQLATDLESCVLATGRKWKET